MIQLFYYRLNHQLKPETFNCLLQTLPIPTQNKILKFRNWQDAERCLAGNILLVRGLQLAGRTGYSLQHLKYTEFQKPYLDDTISFNVAHSGSYVLCAISEINKVGVDVEEIKPLPMFDFANLFACREWEQVINGEDKFYAFYTLWTKKEAFVKAIGMGLNLPLNEVVILNNTISWENRIWFLREIKLDLHHVAYLCCDSISAQVQVKEVYL